MENTQYLQCFICSGKGLVQPANYSQSCYRCNGSGRSYSVHRPNGINTFIMCPFCQNGRCTIRPKEERCSKCKGFGCVVNPSYKKDICAPTQTYTHLHSTSGLCYVNNSSCNPY